MKHKKSNIDGQVFLLIGNLLLAGSLIFSGYLFFKQPELVGTSIPIKLLVYIIPGAGLILETIGFTRLKGLGQSTRGDWNFFIASILILASIVWYVVSPNRSNKIITAYLNNATVLQDTESLPITDSTTASLADEAEDYSIVVVTKNGDRWQIADLNKTIPAKFRAAGDQHLRYVVIIDEVPSGEVLSDKWQAYYKRGIEMSDPKPVKYVHYDWHVTVVDVKLDEILLNEILSPEPPDDYRKPLESIVYVKPTQEQLLYLLGFD